MYSQEWEKDGFTIKGGAHISGPVGYRYVYDLSGNAFGVIVDYETSSDFHYELRIGDWQNFCDKVLGEENEVEAFRVFIKKKRNRNN